MRKCNKKLRKGEYEELLDKFDQNGENDPKAPHITLSAGINSEAVTKSDPRGVLKGHAVGDFICFIRQISIL